MTWEEEREEDFEESDGYVIIVIVQDANSIRQEMRLSWARQAVSLQLFNTAAATRSLINHRKITILLQ